jgi:hypothetical protein
MTQIELLNEIVNLKNVKGVLIKKPNNYAIVEIKDKDTGHIYHIFKFRTVHSARNFLDVVGLYKYEEIDKSRD